MPIGFRSKSGITQAEGVGGFNVNSIPGSGSAGPQAFVVFASASNLPISDPTISIQLLPSMHFTEGTDENGNISVTATWVNTGDDIHYALVGGPTGAFTDGAWNYITSIILTHGSSDIEIDIQFGILDPVADYNQVLTVNPTDPTVDPPNWNGDIGTTNLNFTYDNTTMEDPDAFAIYQNDVVLASVPFNGTNYSYPVVVFAAGPYNYKVVAYKYPNSVSGPSDTISIDFGGIPSLELVMDGGFEMGGSFVFNFLVDPSGIYKLTSGLTHDTLYNRADPLDITTVDVAIPNPFIDTFFVGK
jgi:hypothetical protein